MQAEEIIAWQYVSYFWLAELFLGSVVVKGKDPMFILLALTMATIFMSVVCLCS